MRGVLLAIGLVIGGGSAQAGVTLTGKAAELYDLAIRDGRFTSIFLSVSTEVKATSDNRSFYVLWQKTERPRLWIVMLHGTGNPAKGFATDEFASWLPFIADRDVGVISLQWWLGGGSTIADLYTPQQIYTEVSRLLDALAVKPGTVMLEGF